MYYSKNELELCDIIQIQFTMTKDLDAVYPAVAAREIRYYRSCIDVHTGIVCCRKFEKMYSLCSVV